MTVHTKEDVFSLIQEYCLTLQGLGVRRLGLFGSFVCEKQTGDSDVDILVEFERGRKTFDNFINVAFLLEKIFGRRVDLVTPESLSPYIGPRIMDEVEYVPFGD